MTPGGTDSIPPRPPPTRLPPTTPLLPMIPPSTDLRPPMAQTTRTPPMVGDRSPPSLTVRQAAPRTKKNPRSIRSMITMICQDRNLTLGISRTRQGGQAIKIIRQEDISNFKGLKKWLF